MEQYDQIINPKTNRKIYLYGEAYQNLIKNKDYTEEYLLSLKRYPTNKRPKSPKIKHYMLQKTNMLQEINIMNLPNEIMMNEIFKNLKTIELINLCRTNKRFQQLCVNNKNIHILQNSLKYQTLACGYANTYIIKNNILYGVGSDAHGQLGTGKQGKGYGFSIKKMMIEQPLSVACGHNHMIVLTSHGLYGCGYNVSGQLTGQERHYLTLTKIETPGRVLQMACSDDRSYIITTKGLYYTGKDVSQWTKIDIEDPIMVQTGYNHVAVATVKGLYQFGDMEGKGLGFYAKPYFVNIDGVNDILAMNCGHGYTIILTTTGLYDYNNYNRTKHLISTPIKFNNTKQISCQSHTIYLLTEDAQLYFFGENVLNKPFGDMTPLEFKNPIVDIVSSSQHSVVLDNQGIYYGHGSNYHKQLGAAGNVAGFSPCHYFK